MHRIIPKSIHVVILLIINFGYGRNCIKMMLHYSIQHNFCNFAASSLVFFLGVFICAILVYKPKMFC